MKTISKKQFKNAVETVLAGGKSKMITTTEVYPFYWSRSKGHNKLCGEVPQNSKFIKNTGRGGKASDLYLVCHLANGYMISETKAEQTKREKIEDKKSEAKKIQAKQKREVKKAEFQAMAKSYGLTTKEYSEKLAELAELNANLYAEYEAQKAELLANFEGKNEMFKIYNRVKFGQIISDSGIKFQSISLTEIL